MNVKLLIDDITVLESQCTAKLTSSNNILMTIKEINSHLFSYYQLSKEKYQEATFTSTQNQIDYFKLYNSQLIKLCLFYKEIYHIERSLISKSKKKQLKILQSHIDRIDLTSSHYQAFISYITEQSTHHDELYFLPSSSTSSPDQWLFDRDPNFSTYHSHLLGHILCTLQTLTYIDIKLEHLKHGNHHIPAFHTTKWKASKTDFVELVYAINSSGALDIEITALFELLSQVIDTGPLDEFNKWKNIKNRAGSQPRFIPKLLESLQNKINQDFE